MASKQPHADNIVNERRLKPIYDRLDYGNNKKALQEADKVLKKHPNNQCARVLKALALLRLGKKEECQSIIDKVRSEIPHEDATLQAMSICYRETQQPDKISEVYEAASKADPNNEELLTHLFMSYVRLGDFKKQQQTALALYKLVPNNPYYFWAVMSLVMQANQAVEKQAKNIILSLAERMVLKLVGEKKIEAEQEVQLYLMILELQGKTEEMYNVLCSPLADRLSNVAPRKAKLLLLMERYEEAVTAYKDLINNDRDNWSYYMDYLTAGLHCQTATQCYKFLNDIITTTLNEKIRAPQLSRLELLKRTRQQGLEIEHCAPIIDDMRQYFKHFGSKDCIISDLKLYLHLINDEEKDELIKNIQLDIEMDDNEFPTSISQMQKHIHLEQLKRIFGYHHNSRANIDERKNLVKRYCELYKKGNEFYPLEKRSPSEYYSCDYYALLACHLLHQLWFETSDASWLYKAMMLLENGLVYSPGNHQLKILLIKTYLEAGLAEAADCIFSQLECKHIQLDSLGYLHCTLLAPLGYLSQAATAFEHVSKFFITNYKDSTDHLTYAYKYGSFLKIQEFLELKVRLEDSLHFATITTEKMLLELSWCDSISSITNALSNMNIQSRDPNNLRDNRDVDVTVAWEPYTKLDQDIRMKNETKDCMIKILAARNLILRILAAANESENMKTLSNLALQLKKLNDEDIPTVLCKFENEGKNIINCVVVPMDAVERLREAYYSEQLSLISQFVDRLSNAYHPDSDCIKLLQLSKCLDAPNLPNENTPVSYKKFFLRATTCGETLAFLASISVSMASQMKPNNARKKNKKKNTKESIHSNSSENQDWDEIVKLITERLLNLELILNNLEKLVICTGLSEKDLVATKVEKLVQLSISTSCSTLKSRVVNTLKLIKSLKS